MKTFGDKYRGNLEVERRIYSDVVLIRQGENLVQIDQYNLPNVIAELARLEIKDEIHAA